MPSLIIGGAAYGAGELVFRSSKKMTENEKISFYDTLVEAKNKNMKIAKIATQIEDPELVKNIKEINETITKMIDTVEKNPKKYDKMNNFFNYYLPVTINILSKYDEIENQKLTSSDSKKFMESTKSMVKKINSAFKGQLSNLYQSDMIDTDAEMKVFESMLESEGYEEEQDFNIEKKEEEN